MVNLLSRTLLIIPSVENRQKFTLCKNAGTILKSALLRKICQSLINQQTYNLRRNAIFVPILTIKRALKRFYSASAKSCPWRQAGAKSGLSSQSGDMAEAIVRVATKLGAIHDLAEIMSKID